MPPPSGPLSRPPERNPAGSANHWTSRYAQRLGRVDDYASKTILRSLRVCEHTWQSLIVPARPLEPLPALRCLGACGNSVEHGEFILRQVKLGCAEILPQVCDG